METSWLTTLLIWTAISLIVWYIISTVWHYSLFYRMGIPGPFPYPIVGTFVYMMRQGFRDFQISNYKRYEGHKVSKRKHNLKISNKNLVTWYIYKKKKKKKKKKHFLSIPKILHDDNSECGV